MQLRVLALAVLVVPAIAHTCPSAVVVNGTCLSTAQVQAVAAQVGEVPPGRYWYDPRSRLYGPVGGPPEDQLPPGLALPGKLARNASRGKSGVLINGREATVEEARELGLSGKRGAYTLDDQGQLSTSAGAAVPGAAGEVDEPAPSGAKGTGACPTRFTVNRQCVSAATLQALGVNSPPVGDYWYDSRAGLAGKLGGPVLTRLPPGLPLPGPMPAGASGGSGGVFVNGRQIHPVELQMLSASFGFIQPGRYWLDANGNAGVEGNPVPIANLLRRGGGGPGGSDWTYNNGNSGPNTFMAGGGPGCIYSMTESSSVYVGCD